MKQPEALRLAEILESERITEKQELQAAAELRRLHEVSTEILDALQKLVNGNGFAPSENLNRAHAAIAKATGEQA